MTTATKQDLRLLIRKYDEADRRAYDGTRLFAPSLDALQSPSGMPYLEPSNGFEAHGPYGHARTAHNSLKRERANEWFGNHSELAYWCPTSELWFQGVPMVRPIEDSDDAPEGAIAVLCCRKCKGAIGYI